MRCLPFILLAIYVTRSDCLLPRVSRHSDSYKNEFGDPGAPLILTPLIENGQLELARNSSSVNHTKFLNVTSYSGYFTVNRTFNSNLFFWFFPAEEDYENAPVILWLQGGPGDSSMYGLFFEHGPFRIISEGTIELNSHRWTKNHSVIYIDNPVGTGFSFTSPGGLCENQTIIGDQLYEALRQFFIMFPNLQKNDFFVAGESYGGKYTTTAAYTIHTKNPTANLKINLKGLAIGSGLVDPINQNDYADYLYQLGFIDIKTKTAMEATQHQVEAYIKEGNWTQAFMSWVDIINTFVTRSGFTNIYNVLTPTDPTAVLKTYIAAFLQEDDMRRAIHVGPTKFDDGSAVYGALISDIKQSVASWLEELLSHYRVLVYNGQLDIIIAYPLTLNYLQKLNFSSSADYKIAERVQWLVGEDVAGYVKKAGNLTEALIRNAGHCTAYDQPLWAGDLMYKFVRNLQ